jgi:hypothetical protein
VEGDEARGRGPVGPGRAARAVLRAVVLDATDPRPVGDFYRELFGYRYARGYEPPAGTAPEDPPDLLVLRAPDGGAGLCVQRVDDVARPTWPDPAVPQQVHLDCTVPTRDDLLALGRRAVQLGGAVLRDRADREQWPSYVLADPAGHPLCVFAASDGDVDAADVT